MADKSVKLFLSCVSDEFGAERDVLRRELAGLAVEVKVLEDFIAPGGDALMRLDADIQHSDAVVHLIGDMPGAAPTEFSVGELVKRHSDLNARLPLGEAIDAGTAISFTQWEAWLAVYHRIDLVIAAPAPGFARDPVSAPREAEGAQAAHLARLRAIERGPEIRFTDPHDLVAQVFASAAAEPLYRRALAVGEGSYGPDHPEVATRLNNLATFLRATNRNGDAEPLLRRALAIDEASYGPDHPNVAVRLNNLAEFLRAANRLAEAEPLYRDALEIDFASHGPDHPNVATRLNNFALLLRAMNRLREAEMLFHHALLINEKSLGTDHPNTTLVRENLAALWGGGRVLRR